MNKCTKVTLKQDNSDRINSLRRRIEVLEDRLGRLVMSDFNLSNILIELESWGCEGVTVQELEFVLEYIEKGIRNKKDDRKQENV